MKLSIVTPCFNSVRFIEETILSVLNQGYANVEYIIIDGGSTDGTVDIIRKYADRLTYWVSEPDGGMYDAIAKGLERATGDIHCYLNSDDLYPPFALREVSRIFQAFPDIDWITGRPTSLLENGLMFHSRLPPPYFRRLLRVGAHNVNALSVQQESTFWRASLTRALPMDEFRSFRLAGDAFLWSEFARHADLVIANAQLGGFRIHNQQLSNLRDRYSDEIRERLRPTSRDLALSRLCYRVRVFPSRYFYRFFGKAYLDFDKASASWRRMG